jgi:hypothetical protein
MLDDHVYGEPAEPGPPEKLQQAFDNDMTVTI